MKLHFSIVVAGVWQCDERPEIQVRKCGACAVLDSEARGVGWAVFVGGIELLTAQRTATKRHAIEEAQAYADRQLVVSEEARLARMTAEAERQLEGNRQAERDAAALLREGISCAHPEAARVRSRDVWHPDTCGGCGEAIPDADATPTLGPAQHPQARVTALLDRIVRRAQYTALHAMLGVLDSWIDGAAENHEAMSHRDDDCCRDFAPADIRRMVNDAARELRVPEPYRAEVRAMTDADTRTERERQYDDTGFAVAVTTEWCARGTDDSRYEEARQAAVDAAHAEALGMEAAGSGVVGMPAWYGPAIVKAAADLAEDHAARELRVPEPYRPEGDR